MLASAADSCSIPTARRNRPNQHRRGRSWSLCRLHAESTRSPCRILLRSTCSSNDGLLGTDGTLLHSPCGALLVASFQPASAVLAIFPISRLKFHLESQRCRQAFDCIARPIVENLWQHRPIRSLCAKSHHLALFFQ